MAQDLTPLEEQLAHLTRSVEDLSDVVARQEGEISVLRRKLESMQAREAERGLSEGGSIALADQRPPPW
jgi:SlyX protein